MALKPVGARLVLENEGGFIRGMNKASGAVDVFEGNVKGTSASTVALGTAMGNLATGGLAAVGNGLVNVAKLGAGFLSSSISQASELEAQMSGVAAVLGASQDELTQLNGLVKDLGLDPNLKVSSVEAAQAIEVLAKNGLNVTQIMDGAAKATVALANATGAEMATAADVATDAMSQFGITAANMSTAIDGITGVTTNSKLDINDYALAIANSGKIAAETGISFADFNTMLAASASAFSSGADAGTSFKTLIQRLANPTKEVSSMMQTLGLSLFDSENQTRSMSEVVEQLNGAFSRFTDEEKARVAAILGGADASRTVLSLASLTREEFDQLSASVNKSGQAQDSAATRVQNFAGAMDVLSGVIEAIQLSIGQKFLPVLTRLASSMAGFLEQNAERFVSFFETAAGFVSELVGSMLDGVGPVAAFSIALKTIGVSEATIAQFQSFAETIGTMVKAIITFVSDNAQAFKGALAGIGAVLAGGAIVAAIGALGTTIAALASPIGIVITAASLLGAAWASNWGGIRDITQSVIKFVGPLVTNAVTAIRETFVGLDKPWTKTWGDIRSTTKTAMAFLGSLVTKTIDSIKALFEKNFILIEAIVLTAWKVIRSTITAAISVIEPAINQFVKSFRDSFEQFKPLLTEFGKLWKALQPVVGAVLAALGAGFLGLVGVVSGMVKGISQAIGPLVETITAVVGGIIKTLTGLVNFITGFVKIVAGLFQGNSEMVQEAWGQMGEGLISIGEGIWQTIIGGLTGFIKTVFGLVSGLVTGIIDFFTNLKDELIGNSIIPDMLKAIISAVTEFVGNFVDLLGGMIQTAIDAVRDGAAGLVQLGSDIITAISDGILAKSEAVNTAINAILMTAIELISGIFDDIKENVMTAWNTMTTNLSAGMIAVINLFANMRDGIAAIWNTVIANLSQGVTAITSLFTDTKTTISSIWGEMTTDLKTGITTVADLFAQLKDDVAVIWDTMTANLSAGMMAIVGLFTNLQQMVITIWGAMTSDLKTGMLAIATLFTNLQQTVMTIWTAMTGDLRAGILTIAELFFGAKETISGIWDAMMSQVSDATSAMKETVISVIRSLAQNAPRLVNDMARSMIDSAKNMRSRFVNAIKEMIRKARDGLKDAVGEFAKIGKNMMEGMIGGIKSKAKDLADAAKGVIDDALNKAKGLLGIDSPSKVFAEIGRNIVEGLIVGIEDTQPDFRNSIDSLFDVSKSLTSGGFVSTLKSQTDDLAKTMDAATDEIEKTTKAIDKLLAAEVLTAEQNTELGRLQENRIHLQNQFNKALRERNSLAPPLERFEAAEEQQKFLKDQLNFLDALRASGIKASDTLEGLSFGPDAPVQDFVEAQSRLLGTLNDQAELLLRNRVQFDDFLSAQNELRQPFAELEKDISVSGPASGIAGLFQRRIISPLKQQIMSLDETFLDVQNKLLQEESGMQKAFFKLMATTNTEERAKVASQVADAQERLLKIQEKQSQLDFLGEQQKLLDLIKQNELDSSLLVGVTLGDTADAEGLLSVTDKVLSEILRKTNDTVKAGLQTLEREEAAQAQAARTEELKKQLSFLEEQKKLIDLISKNELGSRRLLKGVAFGSDLKPEELAAAQERALESLVAQTEKAVRAGMGIEVAEDQIKRATEARKVLAEARDLGFKAGSFGLQELDAVEAAKEFLAIVKQGRTSQALAVDVFAGDFLFEQRSLRKPINEIIKSVSTGGLGSGLADIFKGRVIDPLRTQIEKLDIDFLDQQEALFKLNPGSNLLEAQKNLLALNTQERANAANKIADAQERLLKIQEKQAQLDFLGEQQKLLDLIKQNGLDASQILAGVTLGAEADINNLLIAMERAVTEIAKQTNEVVKQGIVPVIPTQAEMQQAQLGFLEEQKRLLDLIEKNELDASTILGGITLGINAQTADLEAAMGRAIQAIINKTNAELQIASPSKVFMNVGRNIIAGLQQGINGARSVPASAAQITNQAINNISNRTLNLSYVNNSGAPLSDASQLDFLMANYA